MPATPEQRRDFGRQRLGPLFGTFARLLDAAARRDGVRSLVFIARDGEFLREVLQAWQTASGATAAPALHYARLSRRSTNLLRHACIDAAAVDEALSVRAGAPSSASVLRFLGLDLDALPPALQARIDATAVADLLPLTAADDFQRQLDRQRDRLIEQLRAYLGAWGLPGAPDVAFVDIGWQGSIVRSLQQSLCGPGERLRLYQLGHWSEALPLPDTPAAIEGLLGDWRRGRTLREGAVYQLALLLEAVCREAVPPVIGYDGLAPVRPRLGDALVGADGEASNALWREPIRAGILEAVREAARQPALGQPGDWRRDEQRRLLRLAWFPDAAARAAAAGLRHGEGHAQGWSVPLIAASLHRPWRSPRAWMAGLASPWRTAYLMATGGVALAGAHALLEAALLAAPAHWRTALRDAARRFGRIG